MANGDDETYVAHIFSAKAAAITVGSETSMKWMRRVFVDNQYPSNIPFLQFRQWIRQP